MQLGAILADQVLKVRRSLVDISHSLEDTVLADILGGKFVPSAHFRSQRYRIVHIVDVLLRPVTHVPHKPIKVVPLRHCNRAVSVVLFDLVHEQEGHVLVVDVEDEVGPALENSPR